MKIEQTDSRPALIFIPGYYGTALKDKVSGERVFVTASEFLFGTESIALQNQTLATPRAPELVVDEILGDVRIIPGIYSFDIYRDFIGKLHDITKEKNVQILPFAYDWREDLPATAQKLHDLVEKLKAGGVQEIDIVAHSMGGLVASYYLAYGNQDVATARLDGAGAKNIRKFAIIGTPFSGVFSIFRNMQTGAPFSGNKKLLPAEAVASFPASYQLIPFGLAQVFDFTGQRIDIPVESLRYWKDQKLGLLRNDGVTPAIRKNREEFLSQQLDRALRFSQLMRMEETTKRDPFVDLKILSVIGVGTKTVHTAYYDPATAFIFDTQTDELKKHKLSKEKLFVDGDGTVPTEAAKLPRIMAAHAEVMSSQQGHQDLGNDKKVLKRLEEFLK